MTGLHPVISPRGVDTGYRASKETADALAIRLAVYDGLKLMSELRVGHTPRGVHVKFRGRSYTVTVREDT